MPVVTDLLRLIETQKLQDSWNTVWMFRGIGWSQWLDQAVELFKEEIRLWTPIRWVTHDYVLF